MVEMHELHIVVLPTPGSPGCDILIKRPERMNLDGSKRPVIPMKLLFDASWVYDFTVGQILKCRDGKIVPCLDAVRVDDEWLIKKGYMRQQKFLT